MKTLMIKSSHAAYSNTRTRFSFGELVFVDGVCRYDTPSPDDIQTLLQGFLDFSFEVVECDDKEVKKSIVEPTIEKTNEVIEPISENSYKSIDEMSVVEMWAYCEMQGWDEAEYKRYKKPEFLKKYIATKIEQQSLLDN